MQPQRMGKAMLAIAWILALALLAFYFHHRQQQWQNPNQELKATLSSNGQQTVVLQRNRNNHYVFTGYINQQAVTFFVDTGATDVSIPENLAQRLGLRRGYQGYAQTANGTVRVYATRLDSLRIGPIVLKNIAVTINPSMQGNDVLLGMSALKHLQFTQRAGQLILQAN